MADSGSTLRDVSQSLAARIRAAVYVEKPGDIDVELYSPADEDAARQGRRPLILLYLYLTTENPYLRNAPGEIIRTEQGFIRTKPPVALDLTYMVVAYSPNAETQLLLMDRLKRAFADSPVLEGDALRGSLKATGNTRLSVISNDLSLDQIHHVWASFPSKSYRLSLFYTVTPVRLPLSGGEPAPRVKQLDVHVEPKPEDPST